MTQRPDTLGDAALTAELADNFARLAGDDAADDPQAGIGIAVSGGPDSMALLVLAARLWPERIAAATIDHQLRPESGDEAAMVARYCADHDIPHSILIPAQPIIGNIQSAARNVRYDLLQRWCAEEDCPWLLTAHHADDQLETMLMRLNRGSGVAGMAGVRARNDNVLRPLLHVGKADLLGFCARHVIPFVDDPSNSDMRFDRSHLRQALDGCDWLDAAAAAQSASALAQADEALRWAAGQEAGRRFKSSDDALLCDMTGTALPHDIIRRIMVLALQRIEPGLIPRGDALDRLIAALQSGQTATQGNVLCSSNDGIWRFAVAPQRSEHK
ncbi:MAG: tRNA lysidine(34) synthetase TilS [Pseudomonadota bacterium]